MIKKAILFATLLATLIAVPSFADTVILHDGNSYVGTFTGTRNGEITFTGTQGIEYKFPLADVQSLVFTGDTQTVTLRNGQSYTGHYTGVTPLPFNGSDGVQYQFPVKDVSAIVFSANHPTPSPTQPQAPAPQSVIVPVGTEITIHTNERIDSGASRSGQLFGATVSQDVFSSQGNVAIPAGSPAQLVVLNMNRGGFAGSPELALDLFGVRVNGREYRVDTSDLEVSNKKGFGANRRTAEFLGGGAGLGALLGGIFGGGEGAGIGAAAGAGAGFLTQVFTRGKVVKVPAESTLTFRLDRTLVLRPQ